MTFSVDTKLARRILWLAAPVVAAMISQTAINQVDEALVGRLPSHESVPGQAALATALILMWAIGGSLSAISVGTQAITARRFGGGDNDKAGAVLTNSLIVAVITSALTSVGGWYLAPVLFRRISHDPEVLRLGIPYLQWRMLGVCSMVTTISYKSWFDGLGKTRVHMYSALIMNVINFFLNVALIFGKWGFPRWGVTGSAIASMISSYIGLGIMVVWSLFPVYLKMFHHYRASNVSWTQQWEIVKLSIPSGIATLLAMSGFGLFVKIVGILDGERGVGPIFVAATNNTIIILMLFFTACIAYGSATATLVSQSMAKKEFDTAEAYGWTAVKLGVYFTIVLGGLIFCFPEAVLHVYVKDAVVVAAATPILRGCALVLPFVIGGLVLTQALFGAGNTRFVAFVEFGLHFGCLVPLAYLGGVILHGGLMGTWSAAYVYIVLLCAIMWWKFWEGRWREIQI